MFIFFQAMTNQKQAKIIIWFLFGSVPAFTLFNLRPASFQLIVSQLLHSWGQEGFLQHIDGYVTSRHADWFDWFGKRIDPFVTPTAPVKSDGHACRDA